MAAKNRDNFLPKSSVSRFFFCVGLVLGPSFLIRPVHKWKKGWNLTLETKRGRERKLFLFFPSQKTNFRLSGQGKRRRGRKRRRIQRLPALILQNCVYKAKGGIH